MSAPRRLSDTRDGYFVIPSPREGLPNDASIQQLTLPTTIHTDLKTYFQSSCFFVEVQSSLLVIRDLLTNTHDFAALYNIFFKELQHRAPYGSAACLSLARDLLLYPDNHDTEIDICHVLFLQSAYMLSTLCTNIRSALVHQGRGGSRPSEVAFPELRELILDTLKDKKDGTEASIWLDKFEKGVEQLLFSKMVGIMPAMPKAPYILRARGDAAFTYMQQELRLLPAGTVWLVSWTTPEGDVILPAILHKKQSGIRHFWSSIYEVHYTIEDPNRGVLFKVKTFTKSGEVCRGLRDINPTRRLSAIQMFEAYHTDRTPPSSILSHELIPQDQQGWMSWLLSPISYIVWSALGYTNLIPAKLDTIRKTMRDHIGDAALSDPLARHLWWLSWYEGKDHAITPFVRSHITRIHSIPDFACADGGWEFFDKHPRINKLTERACLLLHASPRQLYTLFQGYCSAYVPHAHKQTNILLRVLGYCPNVTTEERIDRMRRGLLLSRYLYFLEDLVEHACDVANGYNSTLSTISPFFKMLPLSVYFGTLPKNEGRPVVPPQQRALLRSGSEVVVKESRELEKLRFAQGQTLYNHSNFDALRKFLCEERATTRISIHAPQLQLCQDDIYTVTASQQRNGHYEVKRSNGSSMGSLWSPTHEAIEDFQRKHSRAKKDVTLKVIRKGETDEEYVLNDLANRTRHPVIDEWIASHANTKYEFHFYETKTREAQLFDIDHKGDQIKVTDDEGKELFTVDRALKRSDGFDLLDLLCNNVERKVGSPDGLKLEVIKRVDKSETLTLTGRFEEVKAAFNQRVRSKRGESVVVFNYPDFEAKEPSVIKYDAGKVTIISEGSERSPSGPYVNTVISPINTRASDILIMMVNGTNRKTFLLKLSDDILLAKQEILSWVPHCNGTITFQFFAFKKTKTHSSKVIRHMEPRNITFGDKKVLKDDENALEALYGEVRSALPTTHDVTIEVTTTTKDIQFETNRVHDLPYQPDEGEINEHFARTRGLSLIKFHESDQVEQMQVDSILVDHRTEGALDWYDPNGVHRKREGYWCLYEANGIGYVRSNEEKKFTPNDFFEYVKSHFGEIDILEVVSYPGKSLETLATYHAEGKFDTYPYVTTVMGALNE